jgi:hypothetical protein
MNPSNPNIDHLLQLVDMPLPAGEISLIQRVAEQMRSGGVTEESLAYFLNHEGIAFAIGRNNNVQRFKLNQFLNIQYLSIPYDSTMERSYLIDTGTIDEWFVIFQRVHMPVLKAYGLPRPPVSGNWGS